MIRLDDGVRLLRPNCCPQSLSTALRGGEHRGTYLSKAPLPAGSYFSINSIHVHPVLAPAEFHNSTLHSPVSCQFLGC